MKIVCISDTHNQLDKITIPDGDILIHAGDHTGNGKLYESHAAIVKLGAFKSRFKHVVAIAGNHDFLAEKDTPYWRKMCTESGVVYLQDEEVTIDGLRIYGSPWQPWFCDWAFNLERGSELKEKWDLIPEGIDILVTHGPPQGFGDKLSDRGSQPGVNIGCYDLLQALERVKPKLHVFGHIHEGYGEYQYGSIKLVNASNCDEYYRPINLPIVVELEK